MRFRHRCGKLGGLFREASFEMYKTILVPLDLSDADATILDHVTALAKELGSQIVLFHVADGWAAQMYGEEAVSTEVTGDRAYLDGIREKLLSQGIASEAVLAFGDPVSEIISWTQSHECQLIAMGTHGHRLLGDLVFGETASHVQHRVSVPVLLLRTKK